MIKTLSLYTGLCASASLFANGKVLAATHEERFTRKKNDEVFPRNAIDYCFRETGFNSSDLDGVAIASFFSPFDHTLLRWSQWSVDDYLKEQNQRWYPYLIKKSGELRVKKS